MEGRRGKLVRQLATSSSPSPPLASSARWCLAWHYTIFLRYLDWEMMIKTEIKISITEIIYIVGRPTRQCLPDLGFWRQPLTAKVRRLFWKNVMSAFRWLIVKNPIYENPCTRCQHQLIRGANHKNLFLTMEMKLMVMNTWTRIPTCCNVNTSIYSQELENCDAWLIEICIQ